MENLDSVKLHKYLSGAIIIKGKYLLLRSAFTKVFKEQGYYFPGCIKNPKYEDEKTLARQLEMKYKLRVVVDDLIGDIVVQIDKKNYACLYLYKCLLKMDSQLDSTDVVVQLVSPEDFPKLHFDKADGMLAERITYFNPAYIGLKRKTLLSKEDADRVKIFLDSLIYYRKKIAHQDIVDFEGLLKSEASVTQIIRAYKYICARNNISLEQYFKEIQTQR